jgi:hypothetical protein
MDPSQPPSLTAGTYAIDKLSLSLQVINSRVTNPPQRRRCGLTLLSSTIILPLWQFETSLLQKSEPFKKPISKNRPHESDAETPQNQQFAAC